MFSINYRNADENVNVPIEPTDQLDKIYTVISEHIKDNERPLKRPLNEEKRLLNEEERPLNDSVKKHLVNIILLLLKNEGINRNDFIINMNIGRTSLFHYLQMLREANLIKYVGSKKTGGYYLTEIVREKLTE